MITIMALVALTAALVVGLAGNKHTTGCDDDRLSVGDIVGQALTLAVLCLAFVLVTNADSYERAHQAAIEEAGVVDHIFELAEYAPPRERQQIQGAMVCYARAVVHHEWPNMGEGRSRVASRWSTTVRGTFAVIARSDPTLFPLLDGADQDRSAARQNRISEETITTPPLVYGLMILTLSVSIAAFAFSVPHRPVHIASLVGLALLLAATLTIIADLERPFSGYIRIEPVAMLDSAADDAEDYDAVHDLDTLPCDSTGRAHAGT